MTHEEILESARTIDGLIKVYGFKGENLEALVRAKFALEKQIPKKPCRNNDDDSSWLVPEWCPVCGEKTEEREDGTHIIRTQLLNAEYCMHCGQAIDWSEE